MSSHPKVNVQINARLQPFFDTQLNHNSEFQSEIERFKWLIKDEKLYLDGLKVGEMQSYRFKNGDFIFYSLVSQTLIDGIKHYVIEIEDFLCKKARQALKQHQGLFKKCWHIVQGGVDRAASFDFYIQIAIAIGVLSILFASKIVSSDVPRIDNRPLAEHQTPKLPENKQNQP